MNNQLKSALEFIKYDELEKEASSYDADDEVSVDSMLKYIFEKEDK
jgi:hypothetical protein